MKTPVATDPARRLPQPIRREERRPDRLLNEQVGLVNVDLPRRRTCTGLLRRSAENRSSWSTVGQTLRSSRRRVPRRRRRPSRSHPRTAAPSFTPMTVIDAARDGGADDHQPRRGIRLPSRTLPGLDRRAQGPDLKAVRTERRPGQICAGGDASGGGLEPKDAVAERAASYDRLVCGGTTREIEPDRKNRDQRRYERPGPGPGRMVLGKHELSLGHSNHQDQGQITATSTGTKPESAMRTSVPGPPLPGTVWALAYAVAGKLSAVASEKHPARSAFPT